MSQARSQLLDYLCAHHEWFRSAATKIHDNYSLAFSKFSQLDILIKNFHNQHDAEYDHIIGLELNKYIPDIRSTWYALELERERKLFNRILDKGMFEVNSYCKKVSQLIDIEASLLKCNSECSIAVLGAGSLPLTQIYLARKYRYQSVGIERDSKAVCLANILIKQLDLENRVQVIECDARNYSFKNIDHVMLLADCEPKKAILDHIHNSTDATVSYRSPHRLYRLFFPCVKEEDIEFFTIKKSFLDREKFFEIAILNKK